MTNQNLKPTCLYHPTAVLFLDDNRAFLDTLELMIGSQVKMLTFTDPKQAIEVIEAGHHNANAAVLKTVESFESETAKDFVSFEPKNFLNLLYSQSRFNTISVVVVDYEMPELNGVQFCEQLAGKNVFKILLTAEADKDTAINAFNSGTIDKFILKTSENLQLELMNAFAELQHKYFKNLSQVILGGFAVLNSLFENKEYQSLFNQVCTEAEATEYYLVDASGIFLFLDKYANPTWLLMRHTQEIDDQIALLSGYDAVDDIVIPLKEKNKFLFLFSDEEYKKPIQDWAMYQYSSSQLNENYFYSIAKNQITNSIKWNQIVPIV